MKIIELNKQTKLNTPCVATIGFFDGVHKGHIFLINKIIEAAHSQGLEAMIITFDCHPKQIVQPNFTPHLLTTTQQKLDLLAQTAIDSVVVLPFTTEMANLTSYQFMAEVLKRQLNVQQLWIGYDNKFGKNRNESFTEYIVYGNNLNIEVKKNMVFTMGEEKIKINSSFIRTQLSEGNVHMARHCLGRPYTIEAHVINGFQEGRKLGFPTANLDIGEIHQMLPMQGVYATKVCFNNEATWYRGMTSIGMRPTYNGTSLSIETHVLDNFHKNVYGCTMQIAFYKRLRNELKFDCVEDLRKQMANDQTIVEQYFNNLSTND